MKTSPKGILFILILVIFSCKSKPKVIVEDTPSSSIQVTSAESESTTNVASSAEMHQVIAQEILQAERYTYLKVKENKEIFWIATTKFNPEVGHTYLYRGGLLKTNFESQEHKKVFDKIYLVTEIIDAAAHPGSNTASESGATATIHTHELKDIAGTIKLNELFDKKETFKGKTVRVAGKCVKANYEIMNKNWYHLQDGTKINGKSCDLTITSTENIPLGANVVFEGKLILNKDFGSGYRYEILLEGAIIK